MKSETNLTAILVKHWREMGLEVINISGSAMQAPGWPDVFVCGPVWTGWIEFKGPKTATKPHQTRILSALEKSPESACIVRFMGMTKSGWILRAERSSGQYYNGVLIIPGESNIVAAKLLQRLAELGI